MYLEYTKDVMDMMTEFRNCLSHKWQCRGNNADIDKKISFIWMGSFFDSSHHDCLTDSVTIQSITLKQIIKCEQRNRLKRSDYT